MDGVEKPFSSSKRPVLLLIDGHASHFNPECIREVAASGVVLLYLPPNVTHIAQPLDVTAFSALKAHWSNVCNQYMAKKSRKGGDNSYVESPLQSSMVQSTDSHYHYVSGVYPFNRHLSPFTERVEFTTPTAKLA